MEINILDKKEEILELLKDYTTVVHTNADEDFDYLEEGCLSISVLNNDEEVLYVDLEDEITLGIGGWHTHYSGYLSDYNMFLKDLRDFIECRLCAVCIICNDEWMGSFTAYEDELSLENLKKEVNKLLSDREFQRQLKKNGYRIECTFLDSTKNIVWKIESSR